MTATCMIGVPQIADINAMASMRKIAYKHGYTGPMRALPAALAKGIYRADFPDAQPPALPKYFPSKSPEEIAAEEQAAIKAKLLEIDLASIRGLREYIAAKPDAPQILKDKEAEAAVERDKFTNMKTKP